MASMDGSSATRARAGSTARPEGLVAASQPTPAEATPLVARPGQCAPRPPGRKKAPSVSAGGAKVWAKENRDYHQTQPPAAQQVLTNKRK